MARDIRGLIELLEDVLREDLAKLDAHLIYAKGGGIAVSAHPGEVGNAP